MSATDLCIERSEAERPGWRDEHGAWLCPASGESVSLPCPAGRPDAVAGPYCSEHGGAARSLAEAERDWNWLAPESVGHAGAVIAAGTLSLQSVDAYVVLRAEHGRWLAWLGIGSMLRQVANSEYAGCGRAACRNCARGVYCGRKRFALDDRESALRDGLASWRARVTARVEEIRSARGGTLDWGVPVTPLAEPVVIDVGPGENVWDVAQERQRVGSAGLGVISGLRPTGEAI